MIGFDSCDPRDVKNNIILKIDLEQFEISKMAAKMASVNL